MPPEWATIGRVRWRAGEGHDRIKIPTVGLSLGAAAGPLETRLREDNPQRLASLFSFSFNCAAAAEPSEMASAARCSSQVRHYSIEPPPATWAAAVSRSRTHIHTRDRWLSQMAESVSELKANPWHGVRRRPTHMRTFTPTSEGGKRCAHTVYILAHVRHRQTIEANLTIFKSIVFVLDSGSTTVFDKQYKRLFETSIENCIFSHLFKQINSFFFKYTAACGQNT